MGKAAGSCDTVGVFDTHAMQAVHSGNVDALLVAAPGDDLRCLLLWGKDCYNCNLFKAAALAHQDTFKAWHLSWFQADVYQDPALGRRFGLHGVPAFIFYRSGKRLGRITGWPGLPRFSEAINGLYCKTDSPMRRHDENSSRGLEIPPPHPHLSSIRHFS